MSFYTATPPRELCPKARAAALEALGIDDTLAEAYAVLAGVRQGCDYDWPGSERDFRRALALNHAYATGRQYYAEHLLVRGRFDEALAEIGRAQEFDPLSLISSTTVGDIYQVWGRDDQAREQYRKVLAMDPNFGMAHFGLARTYLRKSMYREAIAEFQTALDLLEGEPWAIAGLGYAASGNRAEAHRILADLTERSKRGYFPSFAVATVYTGLGDKDQAFEWLRRAVEERGEGVPWLKVDPLFDPLRSDPRFTDLLRRMNLAP